MRSPSLTYFFEDDGILEEDPELAALNARFRANAYWEAEEEASHTTFDGEQWKGQEADDDDLDG
jgi:hypothetical protein